MSQASRDQNRVPVIIGVSSLDLETPTRVAVNPTTGAVLIDGASLYASLDPRYVNVTGDTMTGDLEFTGDGVGIDADKIKIVDAGGYYTGTDVEAALQEVGEGLLLMPPVEDWYDPTEGLPTDPSVGDRYISEATANGWTTDYIYEWDGDEWIESEPSEGWMVWMILEFMFYFFFSGGWTEVNSKVGVDIDSTPGYLGAASNDGVLRTDSTLSYTDGGDYITLGVNTTTLDSRYVNVSGDTMTGDLNMDANNIVNVAQVFFGAPDYCVSMQMESVYQLSIRSIIDEDYITVMLDVGNLTAERTFYFPDASGTLAILETEQLFTAAQKFGDVDNYFQVGSDGVVTLVGTAKRYLALRPDLDYNTITAQGKPTQIVIGAFHGYSIPVYNNDNEELFLFQTIPGRWDETSDITVHLLVALAGSEDVDDNFKIQLSWQHLSEGDIVPATTHDVEVEQAILVDRSAQYDTYQLSFTLDYDVDTPDNVANHDLLAMRVRRVDATDPDITNEIIILDFHLAYQVDKMFKAAI